MNDSTITNAITIDLEDWAQAVLDPDLPVSDRFRVGADRILKLLDARGVRATFFVLGRAAERAPDLVRAIHAAGHEVQSHGYGHRLIDALTPAALRADLIRSRKVLEDIMGERVRGYRAPAFSVTRRTPWALDEIVEAGFSYDSSVFPVAMRRYGVHHAPHYPHRLRTPRGNDITEVPVASFHGLGRRFPVAGGGYFRLLPYRVIRFGLGQLNRAGHPATIYAHPHEFDPEGIAASPHRIPLRRRVHQGLGRRGFEGKIDRLLGDLRFAPVGEVLAGLTDLPVVDQEPAQMHLPGSLPAGA